jgi:hypothetical protein
MRDWVQRLRAVEVQLVLIWLKRLLAAPVLARQTVAATNGVKP